MLYRCCLNPETEEQRHEGDRQEWVGKVEQGREEQIQGFAFCFHNYLIQPLDVTKHKTCWKLRGKEARESDLKEFLVSEPRNYLKAKECYTQITLGQGELMFITVAEGFATTLVSQYLSKRSEHPRGAVPLVAPFDR